jgi:hypothetical protein
VHSDFRFVITGHTHLAGPSPRRRARLLQPGTWIRLIQPHPGHARRQGRLQRVYDVLEDGKMAASTTRRSPAAASSSTAPPPCGSTGKAAAPAGRCWW